MSDLWEQFRAGIIDSRLLLPLTGYVFSVNFVQFRPAGDQLAEISQQITGAVVEAVRNRPEPSLYVLQSYESKGSYFGLAYGDPTYGFQIELGDTSIMITKTKCSLEEFVLSLPLITDLATRLFSSSSRYSIASHDFFRLTHRTSHQFNQSIVLGPRLTDPSSIPTNTEVMRHFYNYGDSSAYGWLQPELVFRTGTEVSFRKSFNGRPANIWMTVQAPWSVSQRDMVFSFDLRRSALSTSVVQIEEADLLEFQSVAEGFYRDIVISRIYANIFHDISILPSVR